MRRPTTTFTLNDRWNRRVDAHEERVRANAVRFAPHSALERHCKAVHGGQFDPNCAACVEIKAKYPDQPMNNRILEHGK